MKENSNSLDGELLSDGEKALIRALRNSWGICQVFDMDNSIVVDKTQKGLVAVDKHVSFMMLSDEYETINALKLLHEEHRARAKEEIKKMNVVGIAAKP